MAMVVTTTGVRAYPTEPVETLAQLTVASAQAKCDELNAAAERLGLKTQYEVR